MALQYRTALLYILGYNIASERDDSSMANYIIVINSHIGCASSDINKDDSCFFFIIGKHRVGRSQRLKYHILHSEVRLSYAFLDILCCSHLSDHNVEIGFEPPSAHAYRALNSGFSVNNEILWNDMNDFFTYIDMDLMHILY